MAISIKDTETDAMARRLAKMTGETLTTAVAVALRERLARTQRKAAGASRLARLLRLRAQFGRLRVVDHRPARQLVDYDEDGLPR